MQRCWHKFVLFTAKGKNVVCDRLSVSSHDIWWLGTGALGVGHVMYVSNCILAE